MLSLPPTVRIFVCLVLADLRCGFDRLAQLVRQQLGGDPLGGHFFVFRNRRSDRLQLLYWDHGGFCLWYKKYESDCLPFRVVTKFGECPPHLPDRPATLGGMDASLFIRASRR
jgi:transposase